jgi:hypothetical protein
VGLLLWTATSNSIRHFRVMAWRRRANQVRRPARPNLLDGGKGLVPLRVALSPLQQPVGQRGAQDIHVGQSGTLLRK